MACVWGYGRGMCFCVCVRWVGGGVEVWGACTSGARWCVWLWVLWVVVVGVGGGVGFVGLSVGVGVLTCRYDLL